LAGSDPVVWPEFLAAFPVNFTVETNFKRTRIVDHPFGITRAVRGGGETGSLILTDASSANRLAALAPWVSIAVLIRSSILADLQHAVTCLANAPNIVFCTGPSKTAAMEGLLIEEVHGPGQQVALLV
jgi:L-lactate dehydrogenase complex protein LldG